MNIGHTLFKSFSPQKYDLGEYTDKILEKANETFSVMHHKFLKKLWGDNRVTAKLRHNQCKTDWQNGRYEVYIPTRDNVTHNLSYYRVAIKVLPMVSNETKREEAYDLQNRLMDPLGIVESELLILVAPRQHHWGLVRAFKHRLERGYFTAVFVNKSPDIVWKRILCLIASFIQKRFEGLMKSLGFDDYMWKWRQNKLGNLLYYSTILTHFSYSIRQSAFTFLRLIDHFKQKLKETLHSIGVQNMALEALKPLKTLNKADLQEVFKIIRNQLKIFVSTNHENQLIINRDKGLQYLKLLGG